MLWSIIVVTVTRSSVIVHWPGDGVGQHRHVLGGPPQGRDDLVVGGRHEHHWQQEDDDHLVDCNQHSPHWSLHGPAMIQGAKVSQKLACI